MFSSPSYWTASISGDPVPVTKVEFDRMKNQYTLTLDSYGVDSSDLEEVLCLTLNARAADGTVYTGTVPNAQ